MLDFDGSDSLRSGQISLGEDFSIFIGAKMIPLMNIVTPSSRSVTVSQNFNCRHREVLSFGSNFYQVEESEILKGFQALHNMALVSTAWFLILTAALSKVTSTET